MSFFSPVLTGFLLDEFKADVIEHHEADAHCHKHQVAGEKRVLVQFHGLHHLQDGTHELTLLS